MSGHQLDEEAVFEVAQNISSMEHRASYLDQVCAGDQALRERVEALLGVHEQEQEFLKSNPEPTITVDQPIVTEAVGQQIGRYKLLQQIGEGGFGVVYMAEQHRPVRRKVALKVIKPGMDTGAVVARFEAERQALAMMDHPNISRVLDGGATESGRPYFVMELVRGVPITEYCDKNQLSTKARLDLFITVCQAVQHAHQKGVIHRDIKPGNILVTLHDGQPIVKVIDFGVAKAINQQLTEKTLFTAYGQMVGTPQYMSPEQAEMSGLDVDTRSDVYSLGVLLYELLTGEPPLDAERLRTAGYAEMQRIIQEEDPPKPSTRVSSSGDQLTIIAKHRSDTPERLRKSLRGDLDWIVMKALDKDRNRRYDTAKGLVNDIRRHLNQEPVEAGPPSPAYRMRKFAARNRVLVASVSAVLAAIVIGFIFAIAGFARARQASEHALASQILAERESERALEESTRARLVATENEFAFNIIARALGASNETSDELIPRTTVEEVLDATAKLLDEEHNAPPAVEMKLHSMLGRAYRANLLIERAQDHFERALELQRRAYGDSHVEIINTLRWLGLVNSDPERAESYVRQALQIARNIESDIPGRQVMDSLDYLGHSLIMQGRNKEAYDYLKEAHELLTSMPEPPRWRGGWMLRNIGRCCVRLEKYEEAELYLHRSVEFFDESDESLRAGRPYALAALANCLHVQGRFADARDNYRKAVTTFHEYGIAQGNEIVWIDSLIQLNYELRDLNGVESWLRYLIEQKRSREPAVSRTMLIDELTLADVLRAQGREQEAKSLQNEVIIMLAGRVDGEESVKVTPEERCVLAILSSDQRPDGAVLSQALQQIAQLGEPADESAKLVAEWCISEQPLILYKLGQEKEAIQAQKELLGESSLADLGNYQKCESRLIAMLQAAGDLEQAESVLRAGVARRAKELTLDHVEIDNCRTDLAAILIDQLEFGKAYSLLMESQQRLLNEPAVPLHQKQRICKMLANVCDRTEKSDEAVKWRARQESL